MRFLLALLLVASAKEPAKLKPGDPDPKHFRVRVNPRILHPQPFQQTLTVTAEQNTPTSDAEYCPAVELALNDQTVSKYSEDCPPFDEWQQQMRAWEICRQQVCVVPEGFQCELPCAVEPFDLTTRWTWSSDKLRIGFGPGHHVAIVTFSWGKKRLRKSETFTVIGGGDSGAQASR